MSSVAFKFASVAILYIHMNDKIRYHSFLCDTYVIKQQLKINYNSLLKF